MTTTATGPIGVNMQKLAEKLSGITAWQTRCGVSTSADALRYIHYPFMRDMDQRERPVAVISPTPGASFEWERTNGGATNQGIIRGSLNLKIIDKLKDFEDEKEPEVDFLNFIESVDYGLRYNAAADDSIPISGVAMTIEPSRTDDTEVAGDHATQPTYMAEWRIDWDQC